jgi:uncharacterized protein
MQALKNFTELSDKLNHVGAPVDAAECHGFICAQLCLMEHIDEQAWCDNLMPPDTETGTLEAELRALGRCTHKQLEAHDFSFELLLPPDDARLEQRVEALAHWCRGFLFGLGSSGLTEAGLTGDCRELVNDMEHISRVRPDADSTDEESESALMEITEYVRVGALSIYQELRGRRSTNGPSRELH